MEYANGSCPSIDILEAFTDDEKTMFFALLDEVAFTQGCVVFKEGDWERTLFIVREGTVGSYNLVADGSHRDLARYSAGMFFGVTALFEDATRTSTCYAVTDTRLCVFQAEDFYRFIDEHPLTGIRLCRAMTRHVAAWLFEEDNFLTTMVVWGEKARRRAITDDLTGIHNQRYFMESLTQLVSKCAGDGSVFSLLMLDLDNLHLMNEAFGFTIVDEYLKKTARLCADIFNENAVASRLGGDEFAVLLPGNPMDEAVRLAKIFMDALPAIVPIDRDRGVAPEQFTVSIGIAEFPKHGDTVSALKFASDSALRNAKQLGKNRIVTHD